MFGLDTGDLVFPNLTATVKQEEPDYMLPLEVTRQLNHAPNTGNSGSVLRQLMDAENHVEDMEMEINETSLVEGRNYFKLNGKIQHVFLFHILVYVI